MTRISCKDVVEKIIDYIDCELDHETYEELEKHQDQCPECKEFVQTYKMMLELTGQLKRRRFVTHEIRQRLKECLKDSLQHQ